MSPSLTPYLGEQTVSLLACTARRDLGELVAREEGRWLGVRPGVLHMWTLGKKLARNFYLVENLEGVLALVAISIDILSICSSIMVFMDRSGGSSGSYSVFFAASCFDELKE